MRSYWAVVSARFRSLLQYRTAAAAGVGTQIFWGLIRIMILAAFYGSSSHEQPMTLSQVVTYVWLSQATLALQPWNVDTDVRTMIRSGTVVYELLRPLDLYSLWFSRAFAMRTAPTLLRALPIFVLAGLFWGLQPPASLASGCLWGVSIIAALFLSCAFTALLTITLLWTISGDGIVRLMFAGIVVFSGMTIPLPLFPDWAQSVINILPFRGLLDTPCRLYVGQIAPSHAFPVIAQQLVWTVALILVGRLMLARGVRKLEVQGG